MSVIFLLIVTSIIVAIAFLAAFLWAVRSGQYDDTYAPSVRMLFDDKRKRKRKEEPAEKKEKNEEAKR